jgi:hypothetical protein
MKTNVELFAEHLEQVAELGILTPKYIKEKALEYAKMEYSEAVFHYTNGLIDKKLGIVQKPKDYASNYYSESIARIKSV